MIKFSDKKIEDLKIEMNWKGNGSELDPIVINQAGPFPLTVKIYRSRLYYQIKNLTIEKLTCRNAHNISIENCIIKNLIISSCDNLTFLNNTILKLKIMFTKGSTFIDNKFAQIDKIKQNFYSTQVKPIGRQITTPLTCYTCCLLFLTISVFFSRTPTWFFGFIPLGVLAYLTYSNYIKIKRIRDRPDNIYINNVEV